MALPACFHLADDVFPRVRAEAARRMLADGASQTAAAKRLGVSQAMVSKYAARPDDTDPIVLRLVEDVLTDSPDGADAWCRTLVATAEPGHADALADLLAAERTLLARGTANLAPQVGINVARALPGAERPDDVLAYPARIVAAGDRLVRPVPPEAGASHHLATCLLSLRRHAPDVHALVNVRGDALATADATMAPDGDRVDAFIAAIDANPGARTIRDPGAIGIEPCLYVAASSAEAAIHHILETP